MTSSAELSRLLWDARELVEMYADIVEARAGSAAHPREVVAKLDAYRQERGWSREGFGGEDDASRLVTRIEVGFWGEDTRDRDLTRFSQALDALEAEGVIRYKTQLGHRAPYPDESGRVTDPAEGTDSRA